MSAFQALSGLEGAKAPGPTPTYSSAHVLMALLTVGDMEAIGRHALAGRTGLGEGAVRTVVKRLREEGYILVDAEGCKLTPKGKAAYAEFRAAIPGSLELGETSLTMGRSQEAVLVRGKAALVRNGIEQRDSAIKSGATGATTYVIKGSRFQVPGSSSDCEKDFPGPGWRLIRNRFALKDGDVVIVCGSEGALQSRIGALSAALTLLR